jgi:hypothetical protein
LDRQTCGTPDAGMRSSLFLGAILARVGRADLACGRLRARAAPIDLHLSALRSSARTSASGAADINCSAAFHAGCELNSPSRARGDGEQQAVASAASA